MKRLPSSEAVGKKFGRLTVIELVGRDKASAIARCICDCGKEHTTRVNSLRTGHIKSCGCMGREKTRIRLTRHGESHRTSTYKTWKGMNERCSNPGHQSWNHYGGRGVKVCPEWRIYENFLRDMGRKPSAEYSLDRIDVNGDYCPENCRWATPKEQARNTSANRMLTLHGKTQCVAAWAEELNIKREIIKDRINKLGWSDEKALTTPVQKYVDMRHLNPLCPKCGGLCGTAGKSKGRQRFRCANRHSFLEH